MKLAEREMHRLKWRMATEEARKNEGPLFDIGVVSLGALLIMAAYTQGISLSR